VLVIAGANADQALIAAQAVALHSDMLNGASPPSTSFKLPGKQQARRRAALGAYRPDHCAVGLRHRGPVAGRRIGAAECLLPHSARTFSTPERPNAKLRLAYRYNSIPIGPISSMQVRINNAFLGSVPLVPGQEASRKMQVDVPVPVVNLRPFSNSLSFDFTFQLLKKGGCQDTTPINMQGAILRDSYLDLRGYPHYAPLPNLETFRQRRLPVHALADLSETTVVLPAHAHRAGDRDLRHADGPLQPPDRLSRLRVTVAGADALQQAPHRLSHHRHRRRPAGLRQARQQSARRLRSGQIQVHDTQGFFAPLHHAWWKLESNEHTESGDLTAGGTPDAVIEGIKSPYGPGATAASWPSTSRMRLRL
jgi:cellulose synthase (UDP-forming)